MVCLLELPLLLYNLPNFYIQVTLYEEKKKNWAQTVFFYLHLWSNPLLPSKQSTDAEEISSRVDNKLEVIHLPVQRVLGSTNEFFESQVYG